MMVQVTLAPYISKKNQSSPFQVITSPNTKLCSVYSLPKRQCNLRVLTLLYYAIYALSDEITHETEANEASCNTPEPGQALDILARNETVQMSILRIA